MIMGKPRSSQLDDVARARRRSLVELTVAASRTTDEGLLGIPPSPAAVPAENGSRVELAASTAARTAVPAAANGSVAMPQSASSVQIQNSNSPTELAAEIAKDMQARAVETMKAGLHAALDCTKGLASPDGDRLEGPVAECHAVVLELMKVNAGATLAYTRELSRAKTLSQLVELSSSHARRQCELVLQQAELLKSLTRNVTGSGAE
jgi:hypothetical protein